MELETKIRIKNAKWEVNGKTLDEYKGDKRIIASILLESIFRINVIQFPVTDGNFRRSPNVWESLSEIAPAVRKTNLESENYKFGNFRRAPKVWESLSDIARAVRKTNLKKENYKFINLYADTKSEMEKFMKSHPNISTMSFVRAIGD